MMRSSENFSVLRLEDCDHSGHGRESVRNGVKDSRGKTRPAQRKRGWGRKSPQLPRWQARKRTRVGDVDPVDEDMGAEGWRVQGKGPRETPTTVRGA